MSDFNEFNNNDNTTESYQQPQPDFESIDEETVIELTEPINNTNNNIKGVKTFIIFVLCAIILCAVSVSAYFVGKNNTTTSFNGALNLESKPSNSTANSSQEIYEIVNKSVVGIVVYNEKGISGYASGVVYSEDGYIITNDHIYENVSNAKFKIYTFDGNSLNAEFVAGDTRRDLAVLKADTTGLFPATFGNSDELNFGEEVVAVGRPNDATASSSITGGIISFINRRVSNSTSYTSKLIQTDSAINPGSSGGAVVNMYGQVVGITSSKLVGEAYDSVGYAIPTTTVKYVVEELIANKKVTTRAKLGITYTEINEVTAEINNSTVTGLLIADISPESSLNGKFTAGDIITEIDGVKITKGDIVLDKIESLKPGNKITLTIYVEKSGTYKSIEAELLLAESESSYKGEIQNNENNYNDTFDFPYGY